MVVTSSLEDKRLKGKGGIVNIMDRLNKVDNVNHFYKKNNKYNSYNKNIPQINKYSNNNSNDKYNKDNRNSNDNNWNKVNKNYNKNYNKNSNNWQKGKGSNIEKGKGNINKGKFRYFKKSGRRVKRYHMKPHLPTVLDYDVPSITIKRMKGIYTTRKGCRRNVVNRSYLAASAHRRKFKKPDISAYRKFFRRGLLQLASIKITYDHNNTFLVLLNGATQKLLYFCSGGKIGFKGPKRSTAFAREMVCRTVVEKARQLGFGIVELIFLTYLGRTFFFMFKGFTSSNVRIRSVSYECNRPHGFMRPKKFRRI